MTHDERIGARIRFVREQSGWTQAEVAKRMGMGDAVLSRIESGKRPLQLVEAIWLAAVLEVSLKYLAQDVTQLARREVR